MDQGYDLLLPILKEASMKKLLSLFLVLVTILGIIPTAAFAADSEEDALGEVNIYNGGYELGYGRSLFHLRRDHQYRHGQHGGSRLHGRRTAC